MGFVLGLLAVIAVLASVLTMFVVLLQEPKGGGIAAALGGSGMEAIGPAVGGVNRFTSWMAGVWMVACFLHAIFLKEGPVIEVKDKGSDAPAAPVPPEKQEEKPK